MVFFGLFVMHYELGRVVWVGALKFLSCTRWDGTTGWGRLGWCFGGAVVHSMGGLYGLRSGRLGWAFGGFVVRSMGRHYGLRSVGSVL